MKKNISYNTLRKYMYKKKKGVCAKNNQNTHMYVCRIPLSGGVEVGVKTEKLSKI